MIRTHRPIVQNGPELCRTVSGRSRTVHTNRHNGPRIAWTSKLPVKVPNRAECGSLSEQKEQVLGIMSTRCFAACVEQPGWTPTVHAGWNGDLPSQRLDFALLFSPSAPRRRTRSASIAPVHPASGAQRPPLCSSTCAHELTTRRYSPHFSVGPICRRTGVDFVAASLWPSDLVPPSLEIMRTSG